LQLRPVVGVVKVNSFSELANARLYSVPEAHRIIGVGRTRFYQLVRNGQMKVLKNGRRTLVLAEDIESFINSLRTEVK